MRRHVCSLCLNRQGHFWQPNSLPNSKKLGEYVVLLCTAVLWVKHNEGTHKSQFLSSSATTFASMLFMVTSFRGTIVLVMEWCGVIRLSVLLGDRFFLDRGEIAPERHDGESIYQKSFLLSDFLVIGLTIQ